MEVLTQLLVRLLHWHPFYRDGVHSVEIFEGDWFDPELRQKITTECELRHIQSPFSREKDT